MGATRGTAATSAMGRRGGKNGAPPVPGSAGRERQERRLVWRTGEHGAEPPGGADGPGEEGGGEEDEDWGGVLLNDLDGLDAADDDEDLGGPEGVEAEELAGGDADEGERGGREEVARDVVDEGEDGPAADPGLDAEPPAGDEGAEDGGDVGAPEAEGGAGEDGEGDACGEGAEERGEGRRALGWRRREEVAQAAECAARCLALLGVAAAPRRHRTGGAGAATRRGVGSGACHAGWSLTVLGPRVPVQDHRRQDDRVRNDDRQETLWGGGGGGFHGRPGAGGTRWDLCCIQNFGSVGRPAREKAGELIANGRTCHHDIPRSMRLQKIGGSAVRVHSTNMSRTSSLDRPARD